VDKDFKIGGKTIPAGKYAIFTIPGIEDWTLIINKNWNQHLADDYSESEDVVRVKVKPKSTEEVTERLKYEIDQTGERSANIIISWEKISVSFEVRIL
jgi:flagellar biosynthesis component FlhA